MNERGHDTHYTGFRRTASCKSETVPLSINSTRGAAGVALDGAKHRQKRRPSCLERTLINCGGSQDKAVMVSMDLDWGRFKQL